MEGGGANSYRARRSGETSDGFFTPSNCTATFAMDGKRTCYVCQEKFGYGLLGGGSREVGKANPSGALAGGDDMEHELRVGSKEDKLHF